MAEYYPLLARAINSLPNSNRDTRAVVYSRAKKALVGQLRTLNPPVPDEDIDNETLDLERAISLIEQKFDLAEDLNFVTADQYYLNILSDMDRSIQLPEQQRIEFYKNSITKYRKLIDGLPSVNRERTQEEVGTLIHLFEELERSIKGSTESNALANEASGHLGDPDIRRVRTRLAEVASPEPVISPDGKLDAGPNLAYDNPSFDDSLPTLPIRQRTLIKNILSGLPRNSPRHLKSCLQSYEEELGARGCQPIVGLLQDMMSIVSADVNHGSAQEWLEAGIQKAFRILEENHAVLMAHFPLDAEREQVYAETALLDEDFTDEDFSAPFETVAEAARDAHKIGITTDDFLLIADKFLEFARVLATQPPRNEPAIATTPKVGAKKRIWLSGLGFFERSYNLMGSSASIFGPISGSQLASALREAITSLAKHILP